MGLDSFKWILYGDDDTVFFVDGALDMLQDLDYNMPYLLSDDVWFVEDDGKHFAQLDILDCLTSCLQSFAAALQQHSACTGGTFYCSMQDMHVQPVSNVLTSQTSHQCLHLDSQPSLQP